MISPLKKAIRYLKSDKDLWAKFKGVGPWVTKFSIKGKEYGGWYDAENDNRLNQFRENFPAVSSVLEMGSLEGGHTIPLSKLPGVTRVIGLEGRDFNIAKAKLVNSILGNGRAEFVLSDLEKDDLSKYGRFDVVFSLGLLYHLPRPWLHLKENKKASDNIFLWTHFVLDNKANVTLEGYPGYMEQEFGFKDPLSGLSPKSFWPTLDGLKKMLNDAGYNKIKIIEIQENHPHGPGVTLAARN